MRILEYGRAFSRNFKTENYLGEDFQKPRAKTHGGACFHVHYILVEHNMLVQLRYLTLTLESKLDHTTAFDHVNRQNATNLGGNQLPALIAKQVG